MWLPGGAKSLTIRLAVLTEYGRVTDRQTDRQTSWRGIVRAMHTRRAVKTQKEKNTLIKKLKRQLMN